MATPANLLPPPPPLGDQRVTLHGVSWEQYEALLEMRGDGSSLRVTYLEGELELMSPSEDHKFDKKTLARLIEAYAEEAGIKINGYGSWTVKRKSVRRGAEADECYILGPRVTTLTRPDFVIEVVRTSGGIDKLAVYQSLEVPEVWFWQQGKLEFHRLVGDNYVLATRSELIMPGLDPALIGHCMQVPDQDDAVRALRAAMRTS